MASFTFGVPSFPGLPLKALSEELLLLGEVLLDEAVLAHLLPDLQPQQQQSMEKLLQVAQ